MGASTKALLNKKIKGIELFNFIKENIALEKDASMTIDNYNDNQFGKLMGNISILTRYNAIGKPMYKTIFFFESNGNDYKEINGGEECIGVLLGHDNEAQEIVKKIVEHFGGYYIANDCADEDEDDYAVYYKENPKYFTTNKQNSLETKLWDILSNDFTYNSLLPHFGLVKKLIKENPTLGNKEFKEGDTVYHPTLKMFGKFESWDRDDNTVYVTFEDENGYEDTRRVSASALKKLI